MKVYQLLLLFAIILLAGHVNIREGFTEATIVKSTVDGNEYAVRADKHKQKVADLLAVINKKLLRLIGILKSRYSNDPRTERVASRYDPSAISEGLEDDNFTSYSVNKGEKIVFCLRMRDGTDNLVDENTLTYVAIHELAHLATEEIGHDSQTFWDNFKWLLTIARDNGLYIYANYEQNPQPYCGMTIKSNVLNMS
jgi:hypothetical protein